jgi:hypothetical protein
MKISKCKYMKFLKEVEGANNQYKNFKGKKTFLIEFLEDNQTFFTFRDTFNEAYKFIQWELEEGAFVKMEQCLFSKNNGYINEVRKWVLDNN